MDSSRPNIILIVTDDQRSGTEDAMPFVSDLLRKRGVRFVDAHASTPTCCPARATLMTGNHAPKTGVWTNWAPHGGWAAFKPLEASALPVALQEADYRTVLVGKYLNGYGIAAERQRVGGDAEYVPPGWSEWHVFGLPPGVEDSAIKGHADYGYYDYWLMHKFAGSGSITYAKYGMETQDYSTDVLAAKAVDTIESAPARQPLFLMFTPIGPHAPATPARRHANAKVEPVRVPGLANADGKPPWVEARPTVSRRSATALAKRSVRTLLSVDEAVASVVSALQRTGRLQNSLIIFTSDNGLAWGEFNILGTKNYPYTTSVPLLMRWDSAPRGSLLSRPGRSVDRVVSLADIPATIAAAANVTLEGMVDGVDVNGSDLRQDMLVAAWRNRGLRSVLPAYCGMRSDRWLYIRYSGGLEELYNVARDRFLLNNLSSDLTVSPPSLIDKLRSRTRELCTPYPPSYSWD